MRRTIEIISIFFLFSCCKKLLVPSVNEKDGYQEFVINAGEHYASGNAYKAVGGKQIHFSAWLDSSCIYNSAVSENQSDINKLYGFADCGAAHQQSSARFGWSWNGKAFDIYMYCYINAQRESKWIGALKPMEKAEFSIRIAANQYVFSFNGTTDAMPRKCSSEMIDGYQLYPYFGGDEVAPHTMKIYIKELPD